MFKKLFSKSTKLNHKSHPIGTIVVIGFVGGKVSENSPSSKKVPYRGKDQIVMWSLCKKAVLFSSNNTWYSVDEIKVLGVISSESPYVNMTLTSSEPNNEIDPPSPISTIDEYRQLLKELTHDKIKEDAIYKYDFDPTEYYDDEVQIKVKTYSIDFLESNSKANAYINSETFIDDDITKYITEAYTSYLTKTADITEIIDRLFPIWATDVFGKYDPKQHGCGVIEVGYLTLRPVLVDGKAPDLKFPGIPVGDTIIATTQDVDVRNAEDGAWAVSKSGKQHISRHLSINDVDISYVESQPMQPKHKVNFDMNPSPGVQYPTKTVVDMDKLKEKDSELTKQLHEAITTLKEAQIDLENARKIK